MLVTCFGHRHFVQIRDRRIHGREILLHDGFAALSVSLLMAFLMAAMASSRGSTPLMAKKQVCMIVLMRLPMPVSRATL